MARKGTNRRGSVFQDRHGVWWAQLPPDAYGKRPKARARTEQEAVEKLRALERQRDSGVDLTQGRKTIEELLNYWLDEYIEPTAKAKTTHGHRYICTQYIIPYIGLIRADKLQGTQLQRWLNTLRSQGLSEWTLKNAFIRLKSALNMAVKTRMLAENVANQIATPSPERGEMAPLTPAEVRKLYKAAKGHRLLALLHVAIRLGLRRGELIGLRWSDMNLAKGELRVSSQIQHIAGEVVRTSTKTRAGFRVLFLDEDLITILTVHREMQQEERQLTLSDWEDHGLVFPSERGTPLGTRSLAKQFTRLLSKAGLAHRRVHDLRHTAATLMLAANVPLVDVSKILGHSSPEVTARVYAHSFADSRRQAVIAVTQLLLEKEEGQE